MRLPTQRHRLPRHAFALAWAVAAWIVASGCQGPQLDRLDGSPTMLGTQEPVVDNGQPSAHTLSRETPTSQAGDASAPSASTSAAINEKLNAGHREAALNHSEQAEACYRRVLEMAPDNAIANHRLAVLADHRGDYPTAERYYLKAVGLSPNDPDLLSDLGYSYLLQARNAESERYLQAAIRANPQHRRALDNLTLLYAKLGDRDRAFETLKASVGEAEARIRLAQLFPNSAPAAADEEPITASFATFSSDGGSVAKDGSAAAAKVAAEQQSPIAAPPPIATAAAPRPSVTILTSAAEPAPEPASAPGKSVLEKQLADLMERERQRAIEERTQRQAPPSQFVPPPQAAAASVATALPLPDAAPQPVAANVPPAPRSVPEPTAAGAIGVGNGNASFAMATGRVPDDQINDVFAAIDREGTGSSAPAAAPAPPPVDIPATVSAPPPVPQAAAPAAVQASPLPAREAQPWLSTDDATTSPQPKSNEVAASRTASASNEAIDWESIRTAVGTRAVSGSGTNGPVITPNAITPRIAQPQPSERVSTLPDTTEPKETLDRELVSQAPTWPGASAVNAGDPKLSDADSQPSRALAAPHDPVPRIAATSVLPAPGASDRPAAKRPPDEMDQFEAQLQKSNVRIIPGRSYSNAGAATKPATQSRGQQQATASKPAAAGDSGNSRDPWPMHIEPRRDPPPLFGPDDVPATKKKPPDEKQDLFDSGSNSSDVPPWQNAPTAGSSSSSRQDSPAIRPGTP